LSALAIVEFCCLAWFASLIGSFASPILEMELASNQSWAQEFSDTL
jgi:hypothetical protein